MTLLENVDQLCRDAVEILKRGLEDPEVLEKILREASKEGLKL